MDSNVPFRARRRTRERTSNCCAHVFLLSSLLRKQLADEIFVPSKCSPVQAPVGLGRGYTAPTRVSGKSRTFDLFSKNILTETLAMFKGFIFPRLLANYTKTVEFVSGVFTPPAGRRVLRLRILYLSKCFFGCWQSEILFCAQSSPTAFVFGTFTKSKEIFLKENKHYIFILSGPPSAVHM